MLPPTKDPRPSHNGSDAIAFVFDIDGVLVRSKNPIPGASQTIASLQSSALPFMFLTNGGGKTETEHIALLSSRLNLEIPLSAEQFVQSHTPFRDLVPEFGDKTILVLGGVESNARDIAHHYGFTKVVTASDCVKVEGTHVHPFMEMTASHHLAHGREDYHTRDAVDTTADGKLKIAAILVLSSPRDVGLDLTLILDLLLSEQGVLGTVSKDNGKAWLKNRGYLQDGQPKVYFCNPDLMWATSYPQPRVAQGMFKAYLEGGWRALTRDAELGAQLVLFGKPTERTFAYAEKTLLAWDETRAGGGGGQKIKMAYMIGDNPESDIRGANAFASPTGIRWKSILVCTGVHAAGTVPAYVPDAVVKDVKEAVEWALRDAETEEAEAIFV